MPFNPAEPSAAMYGVIPQAYAQMLATRTGDPGVDAINAMNLGDLARNDPGNGDYLKFLRETNTQGFENNLEEGRIKNFGASTVAKINQQSAMTEKGIGGANTIGPNGEFLVDEVEQRKADAQYIQKTRGDIALDLANANQADAAAGVTPNTELQAGINASPYDKAIPKVMPKLYQTLTQKQDAETDAANARSNAVSAAKPNGNSGDGGVKSVSHYIVKPDGSRQLLAVEETDKSARSSATTAPAKVVTKVQPKFIQVSAQRADGSRFLKSVRNPEYKGP